MSINNKMTSENEQTYDVKNEQYIEDPWTIIESYFKAHHLERLVRHQLESYNNFVGYQINKTIEMFNPVTIASDNDYDPVSKKHSLEIVVNFVNFQIYRPQIHENNGATKLMFPQEARLRNFTYASAMTIDLNIKYVIRTGPGLDSVQILHKAITKIHIGKLPIMLKSSICVLNQYKHVENTQLGECKYDAGGYFIINGSEKTVLGQERAAENRIQCHNVSKNNTKYTWIAEMKSVPDFKCISPKQINVMVSSKNNGFGYAVYVQIPRIKQDIPLFIVFRAIGVISDKEICEKILLDLHVPQYKEICNNLQASIIEANGHLTQEECIKYITSYAMFTPINMDRETGAKKKLDFTMDVLNNDLFPHCHNNQQKIYFLGYMTFRILLANFDMAKQDDRDSYLNKRVDLTGTLLNNLFRNYFNKLVKDMEKQVIREINNGSWKSRDDYENIINMTNIYKIIKSTTIENGLKRALATGDFGVKHTTNSNKVGVAQVLNRLTYVSSLSHARRISTPTDKSGKLIPPRKLHNSSWGFLCLTGDVDVLLSNRIDTKKIKDIRNGDWVNTVNRETLLDEPSDMYQYFSKMPDKLYEITTISGRKIKATADHPFLVKVGSNGKKYEMKKVSELSLDDKVIIRHVPRSIPDENTTVVIIRSEDVLDHYRMDLLESNLLNVRIPTFKLKIIARLIGFGGTLEMYDTYYRTSFMVGDKYDACQIADDIQQLGFGSPFITRNLTGINDNNTWQVNKDGAFAYFMSLMRATQEAKKEVPVWLLHAELSIKREFLSGFQCCNVLFRQFININEARTQIINMFKEFNIQCHINEGKFTFDKSIDNLIRHADLVHHVYCEEKRRISASLIEDMKIKIFMEDNYESDNYDIEENLVDNGCVSVPILSILEIEPELVYDFTTRSENHSFVASGFVLSNCPSESPEGASVGIVKNISYMTHITIHSNSLPLYEYVLPFIRKIEEIESSHELYDKVKVFINGAWLGITEEPHELFLNLKEKKYKGIINIYTSIVFNYNLKEIRVCNDGGRVTRPVLRIKDKNILISRDILSRLKSGVLIWDNLLTSSVLENSVIEYIDPEEQAWSMIATFPKDIISNKGHNIVKYTHCEIHPSTIFGILASCIPFPEHNQSPRNTYQCLDINETVLMSDGSKKRIADIIIGDEVVSFHPETMETSITRVSHHYVRETCKKIYKITTVSGREIIATEDHKFMTTHGWIEVQQMIPGDTKIGIYSGGHSSIEHFAKIEYIKYKAHNAFSSLLKFNTWINTQANATYKNALFIEIQSITLVENRLISDITVESENHSFIAGDNFLSSNCAQGKQAMGVYVTNYENRMDKTAYVLNYPARPLVDTRLMNLIHLNKIPSGTNVIVAIMTHTGYNQEDSLIFNKGSIDRGLFVTTIYHTEKDEDKQKINGDEEIRCNPDKTKTKGMKMGNYSKVNSKGVVPENTLVENRDIIIAKVVPIKENRNDNTKVIKFEDQSKIYKTTEETFIDKNYIDRNGEGYNFAKVRLRTFRKPVIGDKFSSRHGKSFVLNYYIYELKSKQTLVYRPERNDW